MKQCIKCGIEKEENEYYINDKKRGYRKSQCKSCFNEYIGYRHKLKQGVYGIFSGIQCLYVGESSRLTERINKHKSNINNIELARKHTPSQMWLYEGLQRYSNITIRILQECKNHKEQEIVWIEYLEPQFRNP